MSGIWRVDRVTAEQYESLVSDKRVFFNEPRFVELNKDKVDAVHYLIVKKKESPRFAVIIGQDGEMGKCPFSAPYSYPITIKDDTTVMDYDGALSVIEEYCLENGVNNMRFTFPPFIYDESCLSTWFSCFYRAGYRLANADINYTLNLKELDSDQYETKISPKGRKHLRKAIRSNIEIVHCDSEELEHEAYQIVLDNHNAKGRATHMSFEQMKDTFQLVSHDSFLARMSGKGIASMIYYHITKEIVQCIYSGYLLKYSNSGVMNYLSWYAIHYYGERGFQYIDRATATEDSIPNHGLCGFKDSIGGKRCLKYTFTKNLRNKIGGGTPKMK